MASPKAPSVQAPLTGKQRRYLRSLGHHLDPIVQLGKNGLTEGVTQAAEQAIEEHELIKVKLGTECPAERDEVAEQLAASLNAHVAQTLGRTILLYRRHPKEARIVLPREGKAGKTRTDGGI